MIDDHCHPFATTGGPIDLSSISLDTGSGPGRAGPRPAGRPVRTSVELMTARLAARLRCEPADLAAARAQASRDWPAYVSGLLHEAGITELVMDTDYPPGSQAQLATFRSLAARPVHRVMRIEPAIDEVIEAGGSAGDTLAAVAAAMAAGARSGVVAFKSILAYRTGLDVAAQVSEREADDSLRERGEPRRRGKACRDWVLRRALGIAAELGLPMQIHTGFGDSDLRLRESNPLLLEELLRTPEGSAATVLLMVGYPWHEELAYLTATRPAVHADLSMFNLYSPVTLADRLLRVIDLAPANKLLLGSDGYAEPEIYWFGALMLRDAWSTACSTLRQAGCRAGWLKEVEHMLFEGNARRLYGL